MPVLGKRQYKLLTGDLAVGASKLMMDLFNAAGSGYAVEVNAIYVRPQSDTAVTGVVSARFNVLRTSSAGTSGQSIAYASASETAATIAPLDTQLEPIPSGISARTIPTGGAAITVRLATTNAFPEETNAAVTQTQNQNILHNETIVIRPGQGMLIKQGTVASVGAFEFEVHFTVRELE